MPTKTNFRSDLLQHLLRGYRSSLPTAKEPSDQICCNTQFFATGVHCRQQKNRQIRSAATLNSLLQEFIADNKITVRSDLLQHSILRYRSSLPTTKESSDQMCCNTQFFATGVHCRQQKNRQIKSAATLNTLLQEFIADNKNHQIEALQGNIASISQELTDITASLYQGMLCGLWQIILIRQV